MNTSIRQYSIATAGPTPRLEARIGSLPELGEREVLVRLEAASLNYRDLLILRGQLGGTKDGLIPLSDGAGIVIAAGPAVTRWRVGDRVAPAFFSKWASGPFLEEAHGSCALGGGNTDGVLAEIRAFDEDSVVAIPPHYTPAEAATLPCAGVTAWQALVVRGHLKRGDTVLVQGTGGVALFSLQFANAIGARVIVLSSSDEKLEAVKALGAWAGVNYRNTPEWDVEVRRLTDGLGVSHVVELGGPGTFDRSLRSVAAGGRIAQIGVLTGYGPQSNLIRLQMVNADINGICVGSAEHFGEMNRFIAKHGIRPVIDRSFTFDEAQAAYDHLASGTHFGKVVIEF